MAADARDIHLHRAHDPEVLADLALALDDLGHGGRAVGHAAQLAERALEEAARTVVGGLAFHAGERLGREGRVARIRSKGEVQLRRAPAEQRRPFEVGPDKQVAGLEVGRCDVEQAGRGHGVELFDARVGQGLFEPVAQGVDHVVEAVTLVCHVLLERRDGHDLGGGRVGPELDGAPDAWGVGEPRPLAQEPAHLDAGVDALFEAPDELDDGRLAEDHRAVRLLRGDGGRRRVGGDLPAQPAEVLGRHAGQRAA